MPKIKSTWSNLSLSIKKLLFWAQVTEKIHFLPSFDSKNVFFLFHIHDFEGSKQGLKFLSLVCKHCYALFRTKWSYWTQKSQNNYHKGSGHSAEVCNFPATPLPSTPYEPIKNKCCIFTILEEENCQHPLEMYCHHPEKNLI